MLTNIKSESNAPFLKSPPLAHKIIFFEKKSTSSSKMGFNVEYSCHTIKGVFKGGVQTPPPKFSDFFWKSEGKEIERKRKKGMLGGGYLLTYFWG